MYDNSASIALAGSGITLLGQTASLAVLTAGGAAIIAMGVGTKLGQHRSAQVRGAHRAGRGGGHRTRG
jgi:hypothetical protein